MIHAAITAGICALCLLIKAPWPLFLLPAAFYVGREIAQAEERYIDAHGGKRDKCPWYCWLKKSAWTTKGLCLAADSFRSVCHWGAISGKIRKS